MRRKAERIKLADVIRPFDDVLAARRCPFGNPRCSDDVSCTMHKQWEPVAEACRNLLERTTVADIIK